MTDYLTTDTELTAVADAIRAKGGTSAALEWPDGYVDAIDAIETGGGGSSIDTASVSLRSGYKLYYTDSSMQPQSADYLQGVLLPVGSIIASSNEVADPAQEPITNAHVTVMHQWTVSRVTYRIYKVTT